ncbi:MAG: UDP-N-acetylmuramoyl-tripeptide--D-alanyl-D-alanine ligase [Clostridia bacterium]|nr:UDP-N-acetylmuramoyl-tripeptide--D-alanyl-D-alanine ligase [Clostridia bacterium]
MKVKQILEAIKGELLIGNLEDESNCFSKDTRIIKPGDTYIGIKGEKFNGNLFWKEAFNKGANVAILEECNFTKEDLQQFGNKNVILVKSTMQAILDLATYKRELMPKDFVTVGITGSVGKTSTKDIVANVVMQKFKTLKTQGNLNGEIGLPFTLFNLSNQQVAVVELGMNQMGAISKLSKTAKPTISVITNVGTSHIGYLGSRENILKAKLEILDGMEEKILIINNDNDLLHKFYLENKDENIKIYTYGIENKSDIMAEEIISNKDKTEFVCNIRGEKVKITVPIGGIHFVYNALSSIMVGKLLGISDNQIKYGIESFELTKKRMEITQLENNITIINDSYNASLESMQVALKYLKNLKCKRKIAVLGDILELGKFSQELHEEVGKEVAEDKIDILICSGEYSKNIIEGAKKNGMKEEQIYYFNTKEEIYIYLKEICKEEDAILLKASNGMKYFEIAESLKKGKGVIV